jgi:salicylate hydroxylase
MEDCPDAAHVGLVKDAARSLRVIICGGGLGGLSAAIALRQKGHEVVVLESAVALSEIGAGIQIPPNSTRILDTYYGLGDKLREQVAWPRSIAIRRYATGTILGRTPLHPHLSQKYGYPYWLIHRADYQRILYEEAIALGAQVILATWVASIDPDKPSVTTADGTEYTADVIVGADGIRSKVREFVLPNQRTIQPNPTANCAYRATVPVELMSADPDTAELMTDLNSNAWIGHQRHVMAYPIRQGAMYNLVMCHPGQAKPGVWNEPGDVQQMRETYAGFDPLIRKVIDKVSTCLRWTLADLPPLPTWLSQSGKVVLIGDAAHAMVPFLAQGASMSIEDGPALAECLSRVREIKDIPKYLGIFEELRKPRCERMQLCSRLNGQMWHLPDGPQQEERDRGFARDDFAEAGSESSQQQQQGENVNPWSDRNFQPWLFGYDVVKEARKLLDERDGQTSCKAFL